MYINQAINLMVAYEKFTGKSIPVRYFFFLLIFLIFEVMLEIFLGFVILTNRSSDKTPNECTHYTNLFLYKINISIFQYLNGPQSSILSKSMVSNFN